jgi:hypothetical protein
MATVQTSHSIIFSSSRRRILGPQPTKGPAAKRFLSRPGQSPICACSNSGPDIGAALSQSSPRYRLCLLQRGFTIQRFRPHLTSRNVVPVEVLAGPIVRDRTSKLPQSGTASCLMMRMRSGMRPTLPRIALSLNGPFRGASQWQGPAHVVGSVVPRVALERFHHRYMNKTVT